MCQNDNQWLREYFDLYRKTIFKEEIFETLIEIKELFKKINDSGNKVMFFGNGGSAAIASHCAVDFIKNAGIKSVSYGDTGFITCLANDYGFEQWMEKAVEFHARKGDAAVFISSSGRSKNILNGVSASTRMGLSTVTFSGFDSNNQLRQSGGINLWVDSRAYNIVEMTHHIWLLAVVDLIIGKAEYPASS